MNHVLALTFAVLVNMGTACGAATIDVRMRPGSSASFVLITGDIEVEDGQRFKDATRNVKNAIVGLQSAGGSVLAGLQIGRRIHQAGYITVVPDATLCASACALAWLAGSERLAEPDSYVGFHAAYVYRDGRQVESGMGNALIGAYLNELGLSDKAIIYITTAPPQGMTRLDRARGEAVGIRYQTHQEALGAPPPSSATLTPAESPVDVVRRFYSALSKGNGEMAAALVTPSKRGVGPFNELNIASFFRSLPTPLTVSSIRQTGPDLVEVSYFYQSVNKRCDGAAVVQTERFLQSRVIRGIRANC